MPTQRTEVPQTEPRARARRATRVRAALLPLLFAIALATGWGGSCLLAPALRVEPVAPDATSALVRAQGYLREAELPGHAAARLAAQGELDAALAQAPGWVAAERLLDEIERDELRGVERLAARRAALPESSAAAGELYLVGRLEGRDGRERFELALRVDPNLAWAEHGLAWATALESRGREALMHAQRALARARDPYERTFFSASLARLLAAANRREDALELLAERLRSPELSPVDRVSLGVQRATTGLAGTRIAEVRTAFEDALRLLHEEALSEREVEELVLALRAVVPADGDGSLELLGAVAQHSSPARDRIRAELLLEAGPSPLALGLLERSELARGGALDSPLVRAARFAAGDGVRAVERWLASLPPNLRAEDGLPRDDRLRAVVGAARAVKAAPGGKDALAAFAQSLLDAGWFREARATAEELARFDLDRALEIDARALAALSAFSGLRRSVQEMDLAQAGAIPLRETRAPATKLSAPTARGGPPAITDLDELLARFDELLRPTRASGQRADLVHSPRLSFGMVGELVHPGPWFSRADERAGLGREGEPVGGLAAEMQRLNRFALFGQMLGAGPDGAVLPRVFVEKRAGEHLGVPWSGTVAWCEGADLEPQAGRLGAGIGAAALHEGYWLDVQSARSEQASWARLAHEYEGPDGSARRARLLATHGLLVPARDADELSRARRASSAQLGEGQRVRLALLAERGVPALDEFVRVTATHEEGHLCDRTRFLPLTQHLPRALGLLFDCGFSSRKVMEALEYRAQLIALCDAPDPRVPLAQVLDSAEGADSGITPHARAYLGLLVDLLQRLDQDLAGDPARFPRLDPQRTLVHQWHWLGAEQLRGLARELAHAKGLDQR